MRAPPQRTMRDLYDRARHRDLAAPEDLAAGRGGGRTEGSQSQHRELALKMEDKNTVRKRLVSSNITRVKTESGNCTVCSAPCSSCLHRSLALKDPNGDSASSQTCSTRSEVKHNSLTRSEKEPRNKGENDDEFSATSGHVSYSATGGSKVVARSSIADDSSEVDMPSKRRRLSRAEQHDDSNSCVTGTSAEAKLLVDKKKLSTSASSRDLSAKDYKDNSIANHGRSRQLSIGDSTKKKGNDDHDMHPSSSGRLFPADSPVRTKKLLQTQSSVSVSNRLSPKRQAPEFGKGRDNSAHQLLDKSSLSNNITEKPLGGDGNRNEDKAGSSQKNLDNGTLCSNEFQEHADIQSKDDIKSNESGKQDRYQDCSMDISSDGKLNIQHDVMTDCGNSEGLIDVNVCDICGDVGREYLLATCTRCLEGAEHTYCMRVKLDKVPDGEWLCEECQLREDRSKTRSNCGVTMVNTSEGKNQSSESRSKHKALQIVVPDLDLPQITCSTPTADQCEDKDKKLHSTLADTQMRQVKANTPAAERLDVKAKKIFSIANSKKLQVFTSDLEVRPQTYGTPNSGGSNKKSQCSEFGLNRKKLRVSTDMESPVSIEGLRSPPISSKKQADSTLSPKPRLLKTDSLRKDNVFSRDNLFKKSEKDGLNSRNNVPVRTTQVVKSSQTLSRSYSLGSMVNAKAPVPSPRGLLSKQLSFNSSNNGPKVKQLAEGVASKLRPVKHFPRDPRDKGPIKKLIQSESFKREGSVCMDAGSSKQKQTLHLSQCGKPGILKPTKEKNLIERRASFSFKKPNIPSSPRPDSSIKLGERKTDQDAPRSARSILKSSKTPENVEKKQSSDLGRSDKKEITVHPKQVEVVSGKDTHVVKISEPPIRPQCVKNESLNDVEDEDLLNLVKSGNEMPREPPEVAPTTCTPTTCESDFQAVPRASTPDDSSTKGICCEQKPLESAGNNSCKILEAAQASGDKLTESPDQYTPGSTLDKPDSKQDTSVDTSTDLDNPLRYLGIPEQFYIWQGSFEVLRHGNSPEMFDGIQAYFSTCASSKVREVGRQLPHRIELTEVPRCSSWPMEFTEVNPTEDSIALFFFAKDVASYERAYVKLLENMLLSDLSLTANIGGTELLIFPSDKLPERIQRWNGLLFFWGIFNAWKASSPVQVPVTGTDNCPLEKITRPIVQQACSPKVLQSLGIDLNECPNDDLSDPPVSLGSENEKLGASVDHNPLLESKDEDRNLNASETHYEETADTKRIVLGHPTADPYGTHLSTISTGEGCDMTQDHPSTTKGITRTAVKILEDSSVCQNKALFNAQQAGLIRSISDDKIPNKHGLLPSIQISQMHLGEPKLSDDPNKSFPKSDMGSLDCDLTYKRQKTSYGKHSTCSFGDELLPNKCLSKIHPLPDGQHNPFDDLQYSFRDPSETVPLKKHVPDHIIHVLSSDDEDSPKRSTSLNKASLKADESSSPLLSLSLNMVASKHNLSSSDTGDDEPLSLSLGLPNVVEGSRSMEMKQFLPEKPGINT